MSAGSIKISSQSQISGSQGRKEVLWNVQQPGDPYDIRKSMIAQLPGEKQFLGAELEIVCLLQAAEIERLSDFLQTYKVRFKDLQRIELDRHSYEVQIKELTQKISQMNSLKRENIKLNNFVKGQENQLKALQKNFRGNISNEDFNEIYGRALDKISSLEEKNEEYRNINTSLQNEINGFNVKIIAFEKAKQKELDEMRFRLGQNAMGDQSKVNQSHEHALNLFKIQIEGELRKLEGEIRILQEVNEVKNREINLLKQENDTLERTGRVVRSIADSTQSQNLRQYFESQIDILTSELSKYDTLLKDSTQRYQTVMRENIQIQHKMIQLDIKIKDRQAQLSNREEEIVKLNELIKRIDANSLKSGQNEETRIQYEHTIRQLNQKIDFLSQKLRLQDNKDKSLKEFDVRQTVEYDSRVRGLSRQNQDLRRGILENNDLKRQIAHLHSERAVSLQEIERLHEIINKINSESNRNNFVSSENQTLRAKLHDVQRTWMNRYEMELMKIKTQFENRVAQYSQAQQSEHRLKVAVLERELDKYRDRLQMKTTQEDSQRTAIYQLQNKHKELEEQSQRVKQSEISLQYLRKENEELYGKIRHLNQLQMTISEYKMSQSRLQKQLHQLNVQLRSKDDQIMSFRTKYLQGDEFSQRQLNELTRKLNEQIESKVFLQNQNDKLRNSINQLVVKSTNVGQDTVGEMNRLNITVRTVQEEKMQVQNRNRQLNQELQFLRKKIDGEMPNKFNNYEQIISNLNLELKESKKRELECETRLKLQRQEYENILIKYKNLTQQYETLKRQMAQRDGMIANFESDVTKAIVHYEQSIATLTRSNEELKRRISENDIVFSKGYERDIGKFNQQNEELKRRLTQTANELNKKIIQVNNLTPLISQNQILRMRLTGYDSSINLYEGEVSKKITIFEQNIQKLTKENDSLRQKVSEGSDMTRKINMESGDRVMYLTKELERLNSNMAIIERENAELKSKLTELRDLGRAVAELQNKLVITSQELERTNGNLRAKCEDFSKIQLKNRNLLMDLQTARRQQIELQTHFNQNGNETTSRIRQSDQTIQALKNTIAVLQSKLSQQNTDNSNLINDLTKKEADFSSLRVENESLKRRFMEYDSGIKQIGVQVERKTSEYENRIQILKQQIQRLGNRTKQYENILNKKGQTEVKNKFQYQNVIVRLRSENQELRNQMQELKALNSKIAEYQLKLKRIVQENQQLQYALKTTTDQLGNSEARVRHSSIQIVQLRRQIIELQQSMTNKYQNEVNRKTMTFEQNVSLLTKEREDLNRKKIDYQDKIVMLTGEIQRLNKLVVARSAELQRLMVQTDNYKQTYHRKLISSEQQLSALQASHQKISNENQVQRRYLQEYQINIRKLHVEFERLQNIIDQQKKQRQNLFEKNNILSGEIERLSKQNKNLEIETRDMRLKLSEESSLQKRITEHLALMVVLFAQIETLRKRISEKEEEVEYVRRASLSPHILKH